MNGNRPEFSDGLQERLDSAIVPEVIAPQVRELIERGVTLAIQLQGNGAQHSWAHVGRPREYQEGQLAELARTLSFFAVLPGVNIDRVPETWKSQLEAEATLRQTK